MEGLDQKKDSNIILEASKICNSLQSVNRNTRKQCYNELEKLFFGQEFSEQELLNIFTETQVYILNGLRDKSESVREEACKFTSNFIINLCPLNDFYLTYIFPIIVERIGSQELIEESEEIRLKILTFLKDIIVKFKNCEQLKPFLNDCIIILCETLKDKHPAIKELSCFTIIKLANALPKYFHLQAESLLKPTISCFGHQRFKIRVEAVKAVGEIVMHSTYKGVDEAMLPMAERLFDQIPIVRETVIKVAANWLLEHRDRYSYFHKMIPLVLTGLNDEIESTRIVAHELWAKIGKQYEIENKTELDDQLNFNRKIPEFYPSHYIRPSLGCRILVQRNIGKIIPAISNELTSWQEDVRVRCSQLLCVSVLHAEEHVTMHLQSIFPSMFYAAKDGDKRVVDNILLASEYIGVFVKYESWSPLIVPILEDEPHFGHLRVLNGLLKRGNYDKFVGTLAEILAMDNVCRSRNEKYQLALFECVKVLIRFHETDSTEINYHFFKILITLLALKHPENDLILTNSLFTDMGISYDDLLYEKLLNHIKKNPNLWTCANDEAAIFLTLLESFSFCSPTGLEIVEEILTEALDLEIEAELRLKIFFILSTRFSEKELVEKISSPNSFESFMEKLIENVFIPSLVWHAGTTAQAIRTMAVTCLFYALTPINNNAEIYSSINKLPKLIDKLIPLLLSLMEDASYKSRNMAIKSLIAVKNLCVSLNIYDLDCFLKMYPELLKRFDDPIEMVRLTALENVIELFNNVPKEFLDYNFKNHRELIIDTLMTHLDDEELNEKDHVFNALKSVGKLSPSDLRNKVLDHRDFVRNIDDCDKLLDYLKLLEI